MNQTKFTDNTIILSKTARKIIIIVIPCSIFTIAFESVILYLIFRKIYSCNKRYFIIANLSVSDIITLFSLITIFIQLLGISEIKSDLVRSVSSTVARFSHIASLLTICTLSIDRYIALRYSLRYDVLVSKSRISYAILILWMISIAFVTCCWIQSENLETFRKRVIWVNTVMRVITSTLTVVILRYIDVIRKRHTAAIEKTKKDLGINTEKLSFFKNLSKSVNDTIKLGIFSTIVVVLQTVFDILGMLPLPIRIFGSLHLLVSIVHIMLNPYVYAITQLDLKKEIVRMCCRHCKRTSKDRIYPEEMKQRATSNGELVTQTEL